ncbi:MAG: class I SAM-dependent methyltransferase [Bryobacterales bacterium]|nr:class I SAM-dependent methyltransferase [Bryobacterales bacterium]
MIRWWLALAVVGLRVADLPEPLRPLFADLPEFLRNSDQQAAQRLEEGEWDHLVFYVLQSTSFTDLPSIDPARAARSEQVPDVVLARFRAFQRSGERNDRMSYFRRMQPSEARFVQEYQRAIRFLHAKEVESQSREQVAALYRTRGHSSDTAIEASYGAYEALRALRQREPALRMERVLILGPGVDFAPRMDLQEDSPPRSYQPFAVAGSLLALGLARREELTVQCADLNPRVVAHFGRPQPDLPLRFAAEDDEQRAFLKAASQGLGMKVTASRLNVVTGRLAQRFDLIVATNLLLYLEDKELALALTNIRHMLLPGGLLIHNEQRPEAEAFARVLGMPVIDARMVRLSAKRRLYDAAVVHRAAD